MLDAGIEYNRPVGEGRRRPIDPGWRGWSFGRFTFSGGGLLCAARNIGKNQY
jgi:hypothetical protein